MRDKLGSSAGVCIYICKCACVCACGCALRRQVLFICLKAEADKGRTNECIFLDSTFKDFTELTSCHRLQDQFGFLKVEMSIKMLYK